MNRFRVGVIILSLVFGAFAEIGNEVHDSDELSRLTDQLISGNIPVYTDAELDVMSEEDLYQTAECYRLTKQYWQQRRAFGKLIEHFPESQYLTKAKLEVAKMSLYIDPDYRVAMAGFEDLIENHKGDPFAESAALYKKALTRPESIEDMQLLIDLLDVFSFRGLNRVHKSYFTARLIERMIEGGLIDDLKASEGITDGMKSVYLSYCSYAAYKAKNYLLAVEIAEENIKTYPQEVKTGMAWFIKGMIYCGPFGMYEEGIEFYQKVADEYPTHPYADLALLRCASWSYHNDLFSREKEYLQRLVNEYPSSPHRQRALELLTRGRFEGIAQVAGQQEALLADADIAPTVRTCGPAAFRAVAGSRGVAVTLEAAAEMIETSPDGNTTMKGLMNGFQRLGLTARAYELGRSELLEFIRTSDVIVHTENHFAWLKEITDKRVIVEDDRGEVWLSPARFDHIWDGYAIVLERSDAGGAR